MELPARPTPRSNTIPTLFISRVLKMIICSSSIVYQYITHKTPKLKAPRFISKIQQSFCSFSVASYTLRRRFKIRDNGGTEQQNMLIYNMMNRVGIVLLRGVGRAASAIVCYGRRGSPICRLFMWQYSSLSHHKGKVTYETKTQQKRTKTTSSVTLTHMLLVLIASSMFRR